MIDARLFARDGECMQTVRVSEPAPPWVMCEVPDVTPRSIIPNDIGLTTAVVHTVRFRRIGVEVDLHGQMGTLRAG